MTYYDVAMAALVIAGMVWGAWRGITWQLASIASLVLGYSVAHPLSAQLAPRFPGDPVVARSLALLVVYAAVSGGVFFAAWIVRTTLRKLQFEAYDRHLGMVLGGLEGALLGILGTLFVVSLAPDTRGPIFASPAGKVVGQVMATLGPVLPSEARSVLAPFWNGSGPGSESHANVEDLAAPDERASTRRSQAAQANAGGDSAALTLPGLIEKVEDSQVGRTIVETAEKEIEKVGASTADGGAVERR